MTEGKNLMNKGWHVHFCVCVCVCLGAHFICGNCCKFFFWSGPNGHFFLELENCCKISFVSFCPHFEEKAQCSGSQTKRASSSIDKHCSSVLQTSLQRFFDKVSLVQKQLTQTFFLDIQGSAEKSPWPLNKHDVCLMNSKYQGSCHVFNYLCTSTAPKIELHTHWSAGALIER